MISIDTVYQTVQALANKEQRGYITPQEFNLFANQALNDIFDQYIYDLAAFTERRPKMDMLGDSVGTVMRKLEAYTSFVNVTGGTTLPPGVHTGQIFLGAGGTRRTLKEIDPDLVSDFYASKWHKQGFTDAVFFKDGHKRIQVWDKTGQILTNVTVEVISGRPAMCYWGYTVVNEKATYNPGTTQNIDLDPAEQADIVIKILKMAGISTEDQQLYSAGAAEDAVNTQEENK